MKIILVIPDGLIQNNFDFKISKTYQSALDLSIKESKLTSAIICLLPGNKFGSSNFEQFWASNYLINKNIKPELILIDGNFAPKGLKNYKTIINGDEKIKEISAASIVAKVYRDKFMIKLSEKFSNYSWDKNFGYGTKAHLEGLKKFGVTTHHRKSFKPVHKILSS